MSRRATLALAGGAAAASLLPRAPALAAAGGGGAFGLAPFTANWVAQATSTKARIVQVANGVRADTPAAVADIDAGALALWSRRSTAGDWTIAFGYRVLSRLSDPGGTFCCFYLNAVGEGTAAYPADLTAWRGVRPDDSAYFRHGRGLRFSFATSNPNPQPGFPEGQLRLRAYDRSNGPLVGDGSSLAFPFTTGVPYRVAVTRRGGTLTVGVTDTTTGGRTAHAWTDPRIAQWWGGQVGFRWRGQDASLTALTYAQL